MNNNCERCGRPGELFYYKGIEAILCGDCLSHLEEIVEAKLRKEPSVTAKHQGTGIETNSSQTHEQIAQNKP